MNKKILIIFIGMFLLLGGLVSAGCCGQTTEGLQCQSDSSQSECNEDYPFAQTSCDQTTFCERGTCVNSNDGTCTPNTPRWTCEDSGGSWYDKEKSEISQCQIGCCVAGDEVAYVNSNECQQIASDYGIDVDFRENVDSLEQCLTMANPSEEGACIIEETTIEGQEDSSSNESGGFFSGLFGNNENEGSGQTSNLNVDCIRTTASDCQSRGGMFKEGKLCSAPGLSDCAKSSKTKCHEGKVYFVDTCGNIANIYNEEMYSKSDSEWTDEMRDYWTEIFKPSESCYVGGSEISSSTCGNCNYREGTICSEYETNNKGMPDNPPEFGDSVCSELSCYYDTNRDGEQEKYLHGESWCAKTPGTYWNWNEETKTGGLPMNLTGDVKDDLRENFLNYNLPGSRYVKLNCYDGEVLVEECKDYRNSACREETDSTGFTQASCIATESSLCPQKATKDECEEAETCQWISGYRRDGQKLLNSGDDEFDEKQGACYPLIAPGLKFWGESGEEVCSSNSITENALYERTALIKFGGSRDKFFSNASNSDLANLCIDNCYAIPDYGKDYSESKLEKVHKTGIMTEGKDSISERQGYYCLAKKDDNDTVENAKTGWITGSEIHCTTLGVSKSEEKQRKKIVYTHKAWLDMLNKRTMASGDCGYKPHAYNEITEYLGDPESEIISKIFQKLSQKGEVKSNMTEKEEVYTGEELREEIDS